MANGRQYFTSTVVGSSVLNAGGMNGAACCRAQSYTRAARSWPDPAWPLPGSESELHRAGRAHRTLLKTGNVLLAVAWAAQGHR